MRPGRWPFGFSASVLAHAASLLLIVGLAARTSERATLFVDLTLDDATERRGDEPMGTGHPGSVRPTASARGRPGAPVAAGAFAHDAGRDGTVWGDAGDHAAPSGGRAMPPDPSQPAPRTSVTEASSLPGPAPPALPVTAAPPAAAVIPLPAAAPEVSQRALHSAVPEHAQAAVSPEAASPSTSGPGAESEAPGSRGVAGGAGRSPSTSVQSGAGQGGGRNGEGAGTGGGVHGQGRAGGTAPSASRGGGGGAGEYGPYLRLWRTRIHEGLSYPPAARRRNLTGTVHIEIAIEANGALSDVRVVESSSHPLLDDAAVQSVRSLPPIPFPPELTPRPLRARLPVVFDLR